MTEGRKGTYVHTAKATAALDEICAVTEGSQKDAVNRALMFYALALRTADARGHVQLMKPGGEPLIVLLL